MGSKGTPCHCVSGLMESHPRSLPTSRKPNQEKVQTHGACTYVLSRHTITEMDWKRWPSIQLKRTLDHALAVVQPYWLWLYWLKLPSRRPLKSVKRIAPTICYFEGPFDYHTTPSAGSTASTSFSAMITNGSPFSVTSCPACTEKITRSPTVISRDR